MLDALKLNPIGAGYHIYFKMFLLVSEKVRERESEIEISMIKEIH